MGQTTWFSPVTWQPPTAPRAPMPSYASCPPGALPEHRQATGRPTLSVAWGPTAGEKISLAGAWPPDGMQAVRPAPAMTVLERAVLPVEGSLAITDVEWGQFLAGRTAGRPSLL